MKRAFTLIELLVSIAISVMIAVTIYFSLNTALESWEYSRDQLALQKVLHEVMEKMTSGTVTTFGLKDSLEILLADKARVEFIPPWVDDTHAVTERDYVYTLNRRIKPGTGKPLAEVKPFESKKIIFIPIAVVQEEETKRSRVRLAQIVPRGSQISFIYHPDPKANPDVIKRIWWDEDENAIYSEYIDGISNISDNPFGVEISNMELRYYDNANNLITDSGWVDTKDLNRVTGIEFFIDAKLGQFKKSLRSFVSLRNAPLRSGFLPLSEEASIPIADSTKIHTLMLRNIRGVMNEDVLQLKATPLLGKAWRIKIVFSRAGSATPKVERYVIEYPPGHELFMEYPRTSVTVGFNLLMLDAEGCYDYDDDDDVDDVVLLKGDVMLMVERMDIEGVGLFVRP